MMPAFCLHSGSNRLRESALNWLVNNNPIRKAAGVQALNAAWLARQVGLNSTVLLIESAGFRGITEKPLLVSPREVEKGRCARRKAELR